MTSRWYSCLYFTKYCWHLRLMSAAILDWRRGCKPRITQDPRWRPCEKGDLIDISRFQIEDVENGIMKVYGKKGRVICLTGPVSTLSCFVDLIFFSSSYAGQGAFCPCQPKRLKNSEFVHEKNLKFNATIYVFRASKAQ